jgi:nucleoside-diphosphate-sugar epimerase
METLTISTLSYKKNFKFIHDDICHDEVYSRLPADLDAIIHLGAQIHVDRSIVNPAETFRINVDGTLKILEFARMNDLKKYCMPLQARYVVPLSSYQWMRIILYRLNILTV